MKTFFLVTNACGRTYLLVYKRIHKYLLANGLEPANDVHDADVIIIDTCAYCQAAEDVSFSIIEQCLKKKHGAARVLIVGCLPGINPTRLASIEGLDVIPHAELDRLDTIILAKVPFSAISDVEGSPIPAKVTNLAAQETKRAFHIAIARGCLGKCAYCAVNKVWGRLESKPIEDIVREFKAGLSQKHELFYLAAQDLGAYGVDLGVTVVDLLQELFKIEGRYKLILHDFNPQWFVKHHLALETMLIEHHEKVAYLDLPIQSGSDRLLRRMRRPYRIDEVKRALFSVKNSVPDLRVEIDIMMGFPGESDEDFSMSRQLLNELRSLQSICVWLSRYSERPDTAATKLDDKLDEETIMRRFVELKEIVGKGPYQLGTGMIWYPDYYLFY